MNRGNTPTLTFGLPFDTEDITKLNVAFMQRGNIVLQKGINDVLMDGNEIAIILTEAETLSFKTGQLRIQLRAGFTDKRMASQEITTSVERILKDGAL